MEKYKRLIKMAQEPLSDEAYLEKWVSDIYQFKSHEISSIKDTNSIYIAMAPILTKMLGFKKINKVIGLIGDGYGNGIPSRFETLSEKWNIQDREVEQTQKIKNQINIVEYYTGFAILKCFKVPIIDPATNKMLGTYAQSNKFIPDNTLKTILNIHGERFGEYASMDIADSSNRLHDPVYRIALRVLLFCMACLHLLCQ